ncbi:hypothetical protein [Olivibacter sp. XZL3]|uniref:hypothetical protein n=1 Tax=Olivibacter sp. XZL3 TaxID=1735116 RepID=UPI0010656C84|nr:hypothetical protein [Olivibacter sp. XZL3]
MKAMKSVKFAISPTIGAIMRSILFVSAFLSTSCFAQNVSTVKSGDGQQPETVPLENFSGYYQLPNKAAFIRFEPKDNVLFGKQFWGDNKEYQLVQINETNFETKKEGHKVEFIKDGSGEFTQAKILGRITTVKVGFDPTIIKQLSAAQLKRLEGTYILTDDNSFKLDIRSSAKGLTLKQLWDNKEITFMPRTETFFLNEDGTFPLTFLLSDGEATQVTCFEDDVWLKGK